MLKRRFVAPGALHTEATAGSLQALASTDTIACPVRGSVRLTRTDRAEPGSHAQPLTLNWPFAQYPPSIHPIGAAWLALAYITAPAKQPSAIRGASIERVRMNPPPTLVGRRRSEEHTSELQSLTNLVCRLLLEKK